MSVVGRRYELAELDRRVSAAADGNGALLLVCGEAGIGKTTMLTRLAEVAAAAGLPVLAGRAVDDEGAPAFWPWLRVLDQGRSLGLSPSLLDLGDGPPAQARFVAVERTVRALLDAAPPAGLLLTLDDLQWADEATIQLLRHLGTDLPGTRLLVAVAARDLELIGGLAGLPAAHTLRLSPLTETAIHEYLRSVAPGGVDPSWPAYVGKNSGGNPLFVRELARALVAEDGLAAPVTDMAVPAPLRMLAAGRLDPLGDEVRWLLGAASVLGEEFEVPQLAEVVEREAERVSAWLAVAVAAGVLVDDAESPTRLRFAHSLVRQARYDELPRSERIAWHRRVADVLSSADGLGGVGRLSGVGWRSDVARHRVRAAEDAASCLAATIACRAAGEEASRALDFTDAAHWFGRAVELQASAGLAEPDQAELLLALATAEYADGQVDRAVGHCVQAADLATRLGRPDLAARAALVIRGTGGERLNVAIAGLCAQARDLLGTEDSGLLARVLAQHALALSEAADEAPDPAATATANELSHLAMAMAERTGDPTALADAIHARQKLLDGPHGAAEVLELGARLRALGPIPDRPETPLWAYLWRIDGCFLVGAVAEADAEIAGLTGLVERLGWPVARWQLLRVRAARAMLAGRFAEALELTMAGKAVADRCQDPSMYGQFYAYTLDVRRKTGVVGEPGFTAAAEHSPLTIVLVTIAEYHLAIGDVDGARVLYERLRPALAALPVNIRRAAILAMAGELAAAFGDVDIAALAYRELAPFAPYYLASSNGYRGAFARPLGILAGALGEYDAADRHLTDAEAMEQRAGAPAELAMARLAHARVLRDRGAPGDRDRAAKLVEQAAHTARRLGMAPTLDEATTLADELSGVGADVLASLTAREREVARLLADGLANRAIAEMLVLSERTVETHVRNLLLKLGLTNRTQVAAWALRSPLRP